MTERVRKKVALAMDDPSRLRVDFLPPSALELPGRLGLTRAPGRWWPGRDLDSDARLQGDVRTIAEDYGAKVLVTLVERHELAELGDLGGVARRAGLEWIHFPIADMWVPRDVGAARRLVRRMVRALERGRDVVVHCWGGLGRAGTIAAACLVEHGVEPARAIELVRVARPRAVQTDAQERFVVDFRSPER
jgi:ADP-ribosyl-[dinitrogen reductase] hydrolase